MSYLVLARKYRPQTFEEIVGQEHVTRTLANAFAQDRVAHAFLFCGPRGVGKTTAARILAKALCCVKGPTATPCGACEPCRTIAAGTAVDYFEIDGASNNSVDDVRELRDGVRYQPAQLKRKIYVIDEVHMLSTAAFNALLKTLEEPPPHVTFIFATTESHKIPVTILSRCQRYDFKLVPGARLVAHLEKVLEAEKLSADRAALALLAREAGGSVRDMLSLADQVIAYAGGETLAESRVAEVLGVADRALLTTLARAVVGGDGKTALETVDQAARRGVDLAHLARSFLGALRDLAVVQSVNDADGLVEATTDELAAMREIVKDASRPQLVWLFERFAKACEELRESPAPRLVLEVALIDMAATEPLVGVGDMVRRLEELERRIRSGTGDRQQATGHRERAEPERVKAAVVAEPEPERVKAAGGMADWEKFIGFLEKKSMTLAGIYSNAKLMAWTEKGVEIGFPKEFALGIDPDKIAVVKAALKEFAGKPLALEVRTIEAAAGASVADVEGARRREEHDKRVEEARAHPATQAVIDTFGAAIKEIKVDG
jgi:DNA polymerase III subunit gamma/tau